MSAPTARFPAGKRWPLVVGAAVALAVGAAAYSKWPRGASSPAPVTVTPFTSFLGREVAPSLSPDGSQIAFAWSSEPVGREDQFNGDSPRPGISFFEFATRKVQRLVDLPGRPEPWGAGLAVSPDGRSILFSQLDEVTSDIMLVENFDLP